MLRQIFQRPLITSQWRTTAQTADPSVQTAFPTISISLMILPQAERSGLKSIAASQIQLFIE